MYSHIIETEDPHLQDTVSPSSDEKWYRGPAQFSISPMVLEAVKRIDALFDIERGINGQPRSA
jgi:hypothetical protein